LPALGSCPQQPAGAWLVAGEGFLMARKQKQLTSSQEYAAKFRDPRWQRKRLRILNRDNWTCTDCGETEKELQVHHGYYESKLDPWEYDDDTLHTLCDECHQWANDLRRDIHFETAKLSIEVQHELLIFVAAMRNHMNHGQMLCLLNEASKAARKGLQREA